MFTHYFKIAFRNILKYKMQTLISVCAIAASLSLLAIIGSLLLILKPSPLLETDYADRVAFLLVHRGKYRDASDDVRELIATHQFKSAEKVVLYTDRIDLVDLNTIADEGTPDLKTTARTQFIHPGVLAWLGYKSAITGKPLAQMKEGEAVLSPKLAQKFFGEKNPVGQILHLESRMLENQLDAKDIKIVDVIDYRPFGDDIIHNRIEIFVTTDRDKTAHNGKFYFLLRPGATANQLQEEIDQLAPDIYSVETIQQFIGKDTEIEMKVRDGIAIFLFLFLMVSVTGYLRQQTQLYRMRQREIALRTSMGAKSSSIFTLFAAEIFIVFSIAVAVSLALSYAIDGMLTESYGVFLYEFDINFASILPISLIVYGALLAIGLTVAALTVRRIKHDHTGLALQMKPQPKHRLRNVGITVQTMVSILFTWVILTMLMGADRIKAWYAIPDNDDFYDTCLTMNLSSLNLDQRQRIGEEIQNHEAVDYITEDLKMTVYIDAKDGEDSHETIMAETNYQRSDGNLAHFFNLRIDTINPGVNPERNVAVSEDLMAALKKRGLWDGKRVRFNENDGDYPLLGTFAFRPYSTWKPHYEVLITDDKYYPYYGGKIVIVPKAGEKSAAKAAAQEAADRIAPGRLDVTIADYLTIESPARAMIRCLYLVIGILSIISIITTVATIYASVSLDTRRRRKEMALRKVNGAKTWDIGRIFARTYLWIIVVSVMLTLPLMLILSSSVLDVELKGNFFCDYKEAYWLALLFVSVITALTIAFKIRDVMKVNPSEYLKD